jgi:hypothetical protein
MEPAVAIVSLLTGGGMTVGQMVVSVRVIVLVWVTGTTMVCVPEVIVELVTVMVSACICPQ